MAKKYNPAQPSTSFQGAAKSLGFNAVKAVDTSKQFEQKTKERNRDLKTYTDYLNRQSIVTSAQAKADQAKTSANFATLKGIASIVGTSASGFNRYMKEQEAAQQKAEAEEYKQLQEDETTGYIFGGETPMLDQASGQAESQDQQDWAVGQASMEVASNGFEQEAINGANADQQAAVSGYRMNTLQAGAQISTDLTSFFESDRPVTLPDGTQVPANQVPHDLLPAAALNAAQQLSKDYFGGGGGVDPRLLKANYLPSMKGAINSLVAVRGAKLRGDANHSRRVSHVGAATSEFSAGVPPQEAYTRLFNNLHLSAGMSRKDAHKLARDTLVQTAMGMSPAEGIALLEASMDVSQIPGDPNSKLPKAEIQNAIRKIRTGAVSEYRAQQATSAMAVDKALAERNKALLTARTPEEVKAANETYEAILTQAAMNGDTKAMALLKAEAGKDNRNDPTALLKLMEDVSAGKKISKDELTTLVNEGVISAEDAQKVMKSAGDNLVGAQAERIKPYKEVYEKQVQDAVHGALKKSDHTLDRNSTAIAQDLVMRDVDRYVATYLRDNPNIPPEDVYRKALDQANASLTARMNPETGEFDLRHDDGKLLSFKDPRTGRERRNLLTIPTDRLKQLNNDSNKDNDINIQDDALLSGSELNDGIEALAGKGTYSDRVQALARAAGVSPRELVKAQAAASSISIDDIQEAAGTARSQIADPQERAALDVIGKYESDSKGGYNAVNQGGADGGHTVTGYSGPSNGLIGKNVSEMTLQEIMDLQYDDKTLTNEQWNAAGKLHAVGRYQFVGSTLQNVAGEMGLDPTTVFTPEVQDQMALHLLRTSHNGIKQWVGPATHATTAEREAVSRARYMQTASRILNDPNSTPGQKARAWKDMQNT